MKKKAIIGLFTSGAVLAGLIAATAIPAFAEVDNTTGDVVEVDAPTSVILGAYESDTDIRVFDEKQGVYVENLATDAGLITGWVDSHLIHQDSVDGHSIHLEGSVTFDKEIIGVIISDTNLDASDDDLGLDTVIYPTGLSNRGLESNDDCHVDGKTITVDLYSSSPLDQIRVLTINKIAVDIDIKPGNEEEPNPINHNGRGVIPVAIFGSADFDVTQIDPETIELEGMSVKKAGKTENLLAHIEDVDGDGFDDLIVQIQDDEEIPLVAGDITLTGNLMEEFGSTPIEGTDDIRLVPDNQSEL